MNNPDSLPPEAPLAPTSDPSAAPMEGRLAPSIRIIGVGSAGCQAVDHMSRCDFPGVAFAALNTDARALAELALTEKLQLGAKLARGLGTGGDPELGRAAAEADAPALRALCANTEIVFIAAGMGGGTGGGAAPALARIAKESGALVLGLVTLPFECESQRRQRQAQVSLQQLKAAADGVICLPNQKLSKLIDENTSLIETFKITNNLLADGVRGIWRLVARPGLINVDFADLCQVLRGRHSESSFATAEAKGEHRVKEVLEKLMNHPLLDGGQALADSAAVLVSFVGGPDLTMAEVKRVMEQINRQSEGANVVLGAAVDPEFAERISVTLVTSRRESASVEKGGFAGEGGSAGAPENIIDLTRADLSQSGLNLVGPSRSAARYAAQVPSLSPEKREQLLAQQSTATPAMLRKASARLKQSLLPLEIVSKGRFEKSEPTLHHGEDLDVPTYIRRGMALN